MTEDFEDKEFLKEISDDSSPMIKRNERNEIISISVNQLIKLITDDKEPCIILNNFLTKIYNPIDFSVIYFHRR